jgi:transglutaminase-like putative cysteine protease
MSFLERLRRVNERDAPEESIPFRVAVLIAVVAAASATLSQGVGGALSRLAVLAGIPCAFWFSHWARYRSGFWLKGGLAIGVMIAFGSFLGSIGDAAQGGLATAQLPLAELFCWVQLLHAFDLPARRDLLFSLMSSMVLMAVAGALSVSMELLPYLLVWGTAAATSLTLAYRSELGQLPALAPEPDTTAIRPATGFVGGGLMQSVTATVTAVVVVGAGLFSVLPPAGQSRAVTFPQQLSGAVPVPNAGGLSNPSLGGDDPGRGEPGTSRGRASFGYFGFAENLDTAVRGRPDNSLVMRVRSSSPDFWRGQTFDAWDGRRWSISDPKPGEVVGDAPVEVPVAPDEEGTAAGPELVQTFYLEKPGPNLVFGARPISTLYFPDRRLFQLVDGTLRAGVSLEEDTVYTVASRRPVVTEGVLRNSEESGTAVPQRITARYTEARGVPKRVRDLAREVTESAPTRLDKVRALEAWLGANTRYTLDVPPLPAGADAVEQYLFEDRVGFCEQIASSLVVMLRSLGVPARLAVGYTPGERNPFTGLYEVRASDAHSWAEVWFPGVGWQAFDPTASVPLSGDGGLSRASSGLPSYLAQRLPHLPAWAVSTALPLGAALIVVVTVGRWWRGRRRRQGVRRTWADLSLARLEDLGEARGRPRRPGETAGEYARALRRAGGDGRLEQVAAVVTRDAFSETPASEAERQAVERILEEAGTTG